MNIIFTNVIAVAEDYFPTPASHVLPEWYKNTISYMGKEKSPSSGNGTTNGTIKRCMPVFDAITSGYILYTPCDVYVHQKDGGPFFEWSSSNLIHFHPIEQAEKHPNRNGHPMYPKWNSPWAIETPKGYSTLFVQPFHRESVFTVFPGVVDTDNYTAPVNFPFVLNDVTFKGLIPAGTPMVQVIPFKRESWKMQIGNSNNLKKSENSLLKLRSKIFDSYKTSFRVTKQYK